jgi:hypothetical protein
MNLPEGKHYGLIAQEVEAVLPELVKETSFETRISRPSSTPQAGSPVSPNAQQPSETIVFKALNYTELVPIVIKGVQELDTRTQQENKALREENKAIREELAALRQIVQELKNSRTEVVSLSSAYLAQNSPNPVRSTTTIRYSIPEHSTSARLTLTNTKGQVVKTIGLSNRGIGQVNLNTSSLSSGTYNYTLYVDGRQVDTKRLIVAR